MRRHIVVHAPDLNLNWTATTAVHTQILWHLPVVPRSLVGVRVHGVSQLTSGFYSLAAVRMMMHLTTNELDDGL